MGPIRDYGYPAGLEKYSVSLHRTAITRREPGPKTRRRPREWIKQNKKNPIVKIKKSRQVLPPSTIHHTQYLSIQVPTHQTCAVNPFLPTPTPPHPKRKEKKTTPCPAPCRNSNAKQKQKYRQQANNQDAYTLQTSETPMPNKQPQTSQWVSIFVVSPTLSQYRGKN